MLSVAGIYIYDTLDDSIKDLDDIQRQLNLPVRVRSGGIKNSADGPS
jgi:capsular polysaccharide biosynthesis protein